jgi:hypothetical protein
MAPAPAVADVLEVDRRRPFDDMYTVTEHHPPDPTAVVLTIERFAITTNNLAYALLGDAVLRSWDAFPASSPGRGRVPVWGIARVDAADPAVVPTGTRLSGYLPMATGVVVHGIPVDGGLLATDEPRAALLPVYRHLDVVDPVPDDATADVDTVLLPIYRSAALLADDLHDAARVIVSSASSRTALALGRLLSLRGVPVTGLTSDRNRAAVETLEVYTDVLTYDQIDRLEPTDRAVYVDVAGSPDLTAAVHSRLGNRLQASIAVGATHVRGLPTNAPPGPAVSQFNTGERELTAIAERGEDPVRNAYRTARAELVSWASTWLHITTAHGLPGAEQAWRDVVAGKSDPLSAVVIRP